MGSFFLSFCCCFHFKWGSADVCYWDPDLIRLHSKKPLLESDHSWFIDLYLESLSSPDTVCLLRFSSSEKRLFPAALLLSSSPFTPHEILLSFFSSSNDLDLISGCLGSPRFIMCMLTRVCGFFFGGGGIWDWKCKREQHAAVSVQK